MAFYTRHWSKLHSYRVKHILCIMKSKGSLQLRAISSRIDFGHAHNSIRSRSFSCVQNFSGKSKLLTRSDGPREQRFFHLHLVFGVYSYPDLRFHPTTWTDYPKHLWTLQMMTSQMALKVWSFTSSYRLHGSVWHEVFFQTVFKVRDGLALHGQLRAARKLVAWSDLAQTAFEVRDALAWHGWL